MTDGTGKVVWEQGYLPFGEDLHKPGTSVVDFEVETRYKFTGQRQVIGIGLYYYGARYYDPETGRFITEDVYRGNLINPLSQNLYIYVLQNPLKYVDPLGYMANLTAGTGGITSKITDEDIERLKKIVEEDDRLTEEEKVDLKDTFNQIKANNTEIENLDLARLKKLYIECKITVDAYIIAGKRLIGENLEKLQLSESEKVFYDINWNVKFKTAKKHGDKDTLAYLLEQKYLGFKYDPNSLTPLMTQFVAYNQKEMFPIRFGISGNLWMLGGSMQMELFEPIKLNPSDVNPSLKFSPLSIGGVSVDLVIGSGDIEVSYGANKYLSIGLLCEKVNNGKYKFRGIAIHVGWGFSPPVNVEMYLPLE
ncbi:hypothetical protein BBF96_08865 [Anoxybacter fermentans]|uniref:RHS repeat-associated core domain-containing protein n=1 Tax=Anoxybacter fermentans TaxID=1323375 RepID=A0A3Q9HSI8_9FIRM|nr:RHS repeat-associated core domain-containing protein [Anoxybacter fermentans]AZR73484.1 hypothetical protein BBF96_08865 [Anoxybacter fermentans]